MIINRTEPQASPIISIETLPLEYEKLRPFLAQECTLHLEVGPRGYRLDKPIMIPIHPGLSLRELDIVNYIVMGILDHMPSLIPWALENRSIMNLAAYLRRYRSSSHSSVRAYLWTVERFCKWLGRRPDELISMATSADGQPDHRGIRRLRGLLEEYVGELRAKGNAPNTIKVSIAAIRTYLRVNDVDVGRILLPQSHIVCEDRAPRPEELQRMMEVADLRGKAVISMLALGGFRIGTLAKLKYRHIKEDLERGIIPVHIHIESEITKGKYCSYDTFIGREAVEAFKLYLEQRRMGSPSGKIPPETILDESPLIRAYCREVKPISTKCLEKIVENIIKRAGLSGEKGGRFYTLRPHSIRKYFRTQLAALGVPSDYIEYMMGHRISTYHDIRMKGVEFLRNIYAASGLSIRPRTSVSRLEMLKEIIRAWGLDPERILIKEAVSEPHRAIMHQVDREEEQVRRLAASLKEMLRREVLG